MIRRNPSARPFFSLGYQLRQLGEFIEELVEADVDVVVDVRETAWSHKRGFSKSQLTAALADHGIDYIHARFAGNPKELRRSAPAHADCLRMYGEYLDEHPEVLSQLTELVAELPEEAVTCFICYERHPGDCHREVLLDRWSAHLGNTLEVKHLGVGGAPRFVKE